MCLWMGSPVLSYLGGDRLYGIVWSQELDKALPEPLPRQFPKDDDQSLVRRNRRMLGKLLVGTLEVTKSSDV
jgi:pinin